MRLARLGDWFVKGALVLLTGCLLVLYLAGGFQRPSVVSLEVPTDVSEQRRQRLLQGLTSSIAVSGRPTSFWSDIDAIYRARLELTRSATQSIDFETYIITPGRRADAFADAIVERAEAGVRVRILADAFGSRKMPDHYWQRLRTSGVQVSLYRPFDWRAPLTYNARTHRKLLLVDGRKAMIGGAGVSDQWDGEPDRDRSPWRDLEIALEGPVVTVLEGLFLQNWILETREVGLAVPTAPPASSDEPLLLTRGSFSLQSSNLGTLYHFHLATAQRRVWLAAPYFLPNASVYQGLLDAARRGLDVRVLTMGEKNDKAFVYRASRRLYGPLLRAGVRIYEYQPGMMHAKAVMVDHNRVIAGSANLDARTLLLNDELVVSYRSPWLGDRVEAFFEQSFSRSHRVELEEWRSEAWHEKLMGESALLLHRFL